MLGAATISIALVALLDWAVSAEVPIGFLYLLPIVLASRVLGRVQIVILGLLCAALAERFDDLQWSLTAGLTRDVLYLAAFIGMGLFAHEVAASRRMTAGHVKELVREVAARRDAEEQLEVLIESSPVAILTTDAASSVLLANDAAHRLFGVAAGALVGRTTHAYLPSLSRLPDLRTGQQSFRTVMQCKGYRQDGEIFIADVWFSTYRTGAGPRLTAMVVDGSEELRDREESSLHQLLAGSRILVTAVSHEIRNICGAIALVHENMARDAALSGSKDFEALGTLVLALNKIAAMELRQIGDQAAALDLRSFLDEFEVVNGPSFRERGIELERELPAHLPVVWADPHSLMQVFLNLAKNSERALEREARPRMRITAAVDQERVLVRVADNGGGVPNPELLFKPFQENAKATGIGLYLSRALMRSFGGELRYEFDGEGAVFIVEIATIREGSEEGYDREDQTVAGG